MKIKKFICLLLSIAVFCSSFVVCANAQTEFKSKKEAMEWAESQVGKSIDFDKKNGAQCVDLIMAYYNFLGVPRGLGNAVDYVRNTIPEGWKRIKDAKPKKGDVLIYAGGADTNYGHLGIYESENSSYHQANGVVYNTSKYYNTITSSRGAPYWGVIRPCFSDENNTSLTASSTTVATTASSNNTFNYITETTTNAVEVTESTKESTSTLLPHLSKPTIKSVKKYKNNRIKIIWKNSSSAQGYQIQYSTSKKFNSKHTKTKKVLNKSSCIITKLKHNKKYYIRIRAFYKTENKKYYSKWSSKKTVKF